MLLKSILKNNKKPKHDKLKKEKLVKNFKLEEDLI